jgi:hypothetical protein
MDNKLNFKTASANIIACSKGTVSAMMFMAFLISLAGVLIIAFRPVHTAQGVIGIVFGFAAMCCVIIVFLNARKRNAGAPCDN